MGWGLHPVFGPGEDRNTQAGAQAIRDGALHPVFGPGEDRNRELGSTAVDAAGLHPVFGPGEDRNLSLLDGTPTVLLAAPGLRTG